MSAPGVRDRGMQVLLEVIEWNQKDAQCQFDGAEGMQALFGIIEWNQKGV